MSAVAHALQQIEQWLNPSGVTGAAAAVWYRGELIAEHTAGEAQPGVPVTRATLFALASVSKPITATTILSLVEAGLIELDESVQALLPEFDNAGDLFAADADPNLEALRGSITVRHLLSHTSGLPEDIGARRVRLSDQPTLATLTDLMCALPLESAPGTELRYSNAGFGILARVAERITGEAFWPLTRQRVLDPLGLHDIVALPGPALADRIALVHDAGIPGSPSERYNSAYWRALGIPWGGLYGTARDLARFAASFLPSGERLLAPPTIREMTRDQARGVAGGVASARVQWDPAFWGLGWEVKGTKRHHWTGELTSPATFCHFGQAGTLLWADPSRELVLAVFANRTVAHLWPMVPPRWARLSNALVAAIDDLG